MDRSMAQWGKCPPNEDNIIFRASHDCLLLHVKDNLIFRASHGCLLLHVKDNLIFRASHDCCYM